MSIEFRLPEVAEGIETVDISEVLVAVGDTVTAGQPVCEVEVEKAVAEIECPYDGTITQLHIKPGDSLPIGGLVLSLEEGNGTAAAAAPPVEESAPAPTPPSEPASPAPAPPPAAAPAPAAPATSEASSGGSFEFNMPRASEDGAAVEIAEVIVSVGQTIDPGDVVCTAQVEKAVAEIECPVGGEVLQVHMKAGDMKNEGDPLLTIASASASGTAAAPTPAPASAPASAPAAAASAASTSQPVAPAAPAAKQPAPAAARPAARAAMSGDRPPAPAGPATRRLARRMGVDLHQITGSGPGGRITQEDLEEYVKNRLAAAEAGSVPTPELPDFSVFGPIERQPIRGIAKASAQNLSVAWNAIPHVTQHDLADITELDEARRRYVKSNPDKPRVTMTAIMIKAAVRALKAFPQFNASIDMAAGEFVLKQYYNIGVAVDTPHGLVVPVIRDCDQKNVLAIAAELTEVAGAARERKLKPDAMQGATFTITNLGGIGGTAFTPIVNFPEVAILGMSRSRKELQLEDGEVVQRLMLPLSLSYDHRIINGADAARFVVTLSGSLSNFFELF